jgi:regulator of cell morphogenesis and NO signaling
MNSLQFAKVEEVHSASWQNTKVFQQKLETKIHPEDLFPVFRRINVSRRVLRQLDAWNLNDLIEHIIHKHHEDSKVNAVRILNLSTQLTYDECSNDAKTKQLVSSLFLCLHDVLHDMRLEEEILFPNINKLVANNNHSKRGTYSSFGLIREWITSAKRAHQSTFQYLCHFHELTNDYLVPTGCSESKKLMYENLKTFEAGFLLHSYMEHHILFPKALALDEATDGNSLATEI